MWHYQPSLPASTTHAHTLAAYCISVLYTRRDTSLVIFWTVKYDVLKSYANYSPNELLAEIFHKHLEPPCYAVTLRYVMLTASVDGHNEQSASKETCHQESPAERACPIHWYKAPVHNDAAASLHWRQAVELVWQAAPATWCVQLTRERCSCLRVTEQTDWWRYTATTTTTDCVTISSLIYDMIAEFNVDSKAECDQLNLERVAKKYKKRRN